jgi:hypothetical protein
MEALQLRFGITDPYASDADRRGATSASPLSAVHHHRAEIWPTGNEQIGPCHDPQLEIPIDFRADRSRVRPLARCGSIRKLAALSDGGSEAQRVQRLRIRPCFLGAYLVIPSG